MTPWVVDNATYARVRVLNLHATAPWSKHVDETLWFRGGPHRIILAERYADVNVMTP